MSAKHVDPSRHDYVLIEPQRDDDAAAHLFHRHNSGVACAACEIERLRALLAAPLGETSVNPQSTENLS